MLGCCRPRFSHEEALEAVRDFRFPMWVLPIRSFLEMSGPPLSHQELQDHGKLVQWKPGMFTIFISHEWLGSEHADPTGTQVEVLRKALRRLIDENVTVYSNIQSIFFQSNFQKISAEVTKQLQDGYIWFDWFSIPQISVRREGIDPDMGSDVKSAVDSIPQYVDAADLFIVLCPWALHQDRKTACNQTSWSRRGWCRVELAAAALGRRLYPQLVEVRSPTNLCLMCPDRYFFAVPGQGDFTVPNDKIGVHGVMGQILQMHLAALWSNKKLLTRARMMTALYCHFMAGLGNEEQWAFTKSLTEQGLKAFLARFRFRSWSDADRTGLSPGHCAAIAGNLEVLKQLVASRANVNAGIRQAAPELLLHKKDSPLHLACMLNGDATFVRQMIELKADPQLPNARGQIALHAAAGAGRKECVELLLDLKCDIHKMCKRGLSPLHYAAGNGEAGTLEVLLARGADITGPGCPFAGSLMVAAILAGSAECVDLLIENGADVNEPLNPNGAMYSWLLRLLRLSRLLLLNRGPLQILTMLDGATPLMFASFLGHDDIVALLLEAFADPEALNREGQDARAVARQEKHATTATLFLPDSPYRDSTISIFSQDSNYHRSSARGSSMYRRSVERLFRERGAWNFSSVHSEEHPDPPDCPGGFCVEL